MRRQDDPVLRRKRLALRQHSRTVRWMKILLPVGALLLIGAIFLSGRERTAVIDATTATDMATLGVGMKLDNPRFAGVTEDGEPFVLTADWALPDGAMPNRIGLERPAGELRLADGRTVTVSASSGEMFREDDRLHLEGNVVLETSDGYRIVTPSVDVDLERKTAVASERLRAEGPRGDIEADRVRLERGGDGTGDLTFRFEGNVRVTFRPEAGAGGNSPEPR